ncbi:hypothetical protein BGX30_013063 [Mortierella sp. GBA39]|nr:hypothetical protein BGX30_013063 [Mortierella sp. GBA39]
MAPPSHRDVLTRELHAGQMISKIEAEADYYEPLPAYMSVPLKKKVHHDKDLLDSVAQFVQETNAIKAEELAKGDEGWHEGKLNEFYRDHGDKRKEAFSENPRRRRSRQRSNASGRKREMGNTFTESITVTVTVKKTEISINVPVVFKKSIQEQLTPVSSSG